MQGNFETLSSKGWKKSHGDSISELFYTCYILNSDYCIV